MPLDEDGETSLEDIFPDPAVSASADEGFSSAEDVLGCLTECVRAVLLMCCGFGARRAHTQREVAAQLRMIFSLVQAVERRARKQLRYMLERADG